MSGCKIALMVGEGGGVSSTAEGVCLPNTACVYNVADTTYLASFTATTLPGWHFVKWKSGDGFICGDSTLQKCTVDLSLVAGNPAAEAIVASNQTFYLMPVFTDELPIPNPIAAAGKEWAPIHLFRGLSWNQIDAVCPVTSGGVCDGSLLGYNMDGWTWADVDEVNTLFNSYIGTAELGPGPDSHLGPTGTFYDAMLADGWVPTSFGADGNIIAGLIGEEATPGVTGRSGGVAVSTGFPPFNLASTGLTPAPVDEVSDGRGGFFCRLP